MTTEQLPELLDVAVSNIEELGSIIATRYADHTGKVHPSRLDRVTREVETCNAAIDAIRAEHAQRVTLQHHACDLAQRVADLESIVNAPRGTDAQIKKEREIASAAIDGALAFGHQGVDAPEGGHWLLSAHNAGKRIAELEAERNTARGAVRELEHQLFALQQQRDVLRTCLDRHQRDEADPPGYLQDAVIRAAGLGALHEQLDAAIKERDELRARLDAAETQKPAAWQSRFAHGEWARCSREHHDAVIADPVAWSHAEDKYEVRALYAAPVPAQAAPDGLRLVLTEARDLFTMYAESHRARGPEHAEKAARNEAMAAKISATLAASQETAR